MDTVYLIIGIIVIIASIADFYQRKRNSGLKYPIVPILSFIIGIFLIIFAFY